MASRDAAPHTELPDGKPYKIGVVTAQWNSDITQLLLKGAKETLLAAGVLPENIEEISVPGSFELPWGARQLIKMDKKDAIICLGCIIQGETKHDEYIAQAVGQWYHATWSCIRNSHHFWCAHYQYHRTGKGACWRVPWQ